MVIGAWSAPHCAGLAANHGVSFTVFSSTKVANAWSVLAMGARGVRAWRPAPVMQGSSPPFRPTRSQRSGDRESRSHDATALLAPGLSALARHFRLCGAQRPRNVKTWANFWLLRRRAFNGDSVLETQ
jgi:hypothetical protein